MYCPKCKYEYIDGITICADCETELVENLQNYDEKEIKNEEAVLVFSSPDISIVSIAKSILEGVKIEYFTKGESPSMGGLFGNNSIFGYVEIYVRESDKEYADGLLSYLRE